MAEDRGMVIERDVGSPYTGMIFLLRRIFPDAPDGRPRSFPPPDMGLLILHPRRR